MSHNHKEGEPMSTIRRRGLLCGLVLLGVAVPALASHNEPKAARTLKATLVKSYAPCTAPNTATSTALPACGPVVPTDPTCDFGPKGSGTATATVLTGSVHDVQLQVSLKGLAANCEGQTLAGVVTVRVTVDDCAGDSCTLPDFPDFVVGTCTVTNGACKFKGTVNSQAPGLLLTGRTTGIEILGCAVKNAAARTFTCGVFVP